MPGYAFLIFLHLFAVVWGFNSGAGNTTPITALIPLTFGIVVVLACATDAARRGTPIVHIGKFVMLFTWPISAPVYLIWSRGWRGLLWSMLWTVTLCLCFVIPAVCMVLLR